MIRHPQIDLIGSSLVNRQCLKKSGQTTGALTLKTNLSLIVLTSCVVTILFYFCLVTRRRIDKMCLASLHLSDKLNTGDKHHLLLLARSTVSLNFRCQAFQ